jgi:poly(A) polymerase
VEKRCGNSEVTVAGRRLALSKELSAQELIAKMIPSSSSSPFFSTSSAFSSFSPSSQFLSGGLVPPLSDAYPTENDLENNESLISYLVNNNVFENAIGQERRDQILENLLHLARTWVGLVGRSRGYEENLCRIGGGVTLKIFGSQKLRVHSPEADMDILCVAPSFVSRYDFFTSFCQMLETLEGVSLLLPIPEAYTPVIKFNVGSQAIDMIFVSLPIVSIPPGLNFQDNHLLLGLDEQGVRSLNGYRVAERLLELVPNVDSYCVTLAAVKLWAKRRGIYANILGFLGGVNFAILVAHVCQMHINSCPATLVKEFFKLYNQWKWPNGILLTYIEELPPMDGGVYFPSWNSKVYPGDKMHLMPIITPTAPAMNSAYNVGEPQKYMILVRPPPLPLLSADPHVRSSGRCKEGTVSLSAGGLGVTSLDDSRPSTGRSSSPPATQSSSSSTPTTCR